MEGTVQLYPASTEVVAFEKFYRHEFSTAREEDS